MTVKTADQVTILDISDAYNVSLVPPAAIIAATANGNAVASTFTAQVKATCGSTDVSSNVTVASSITSPYGDNLKVTSTKDSGITTITFTASTGLNDRSGSIDIPVTITNGGDTVQFTMVWSFALAPTGATGANGTSYYTHIRYSASADGSGFVTAPTSSTKYIGIATTTSKTAPTVARSYTWSKFMGDDGTNGTNGTSVTVKSTTTMYAVNTDGKNPPSSFTSSTPIATTTGQFLWTRVVTILTDASGDHTSTSYSVAAHGATGAQGPKGDSGEDGADAISVSIIPSNGTVLRNNTGSTVLTANVWKGGVPCTVATDSTNNGKVTDASGALVGYVKWYVGSSGTAAAIAATYTVTAASVDSKSVITCKIEETK